MHQTTRLLLVLICIIAPAPLLAQMPFYTDNADVTDRGTLHFEFFNEYDGLQSAQFPDLRQNTANFKFNYGLPHGIEFDVDFPYLFIYRATGSQSSIGFGDTDTGFKWNFYKAKRPLRVPDLSASFYVEFPTGDPSQDLGSGLRDYWLNSIAQEQLSDKTRVNANFGYLFAGNTSTGVLGVQTTRGHIYTGGLSLQHDFTPRLTLGAELYAAIGDTNGLGKDQLQALSGGAYQITKLMSVTFALLGGSHIASPRLGGQVGFEIDFPLRHAPDAPKTAINELSSPSPIRRSP
jgi:hypothetical protein